MKAAFRILLIPLAIFSLTAFGMWATVLAGKHPSPIAAIGVHQAPSFGSNAFHDDEGQC